MDILDRGKMWIESWMKDSCTITRDAQFQYDDTLDPVTLKLIRPYSDASTVYSGKCLIQAVAKKELAYDLAGKTVLRKDYWILVPITTSNLELGDKFVADEAYNDEFLLTHEMRISEIEGDTNRTYRRFLVEEITDDRSNEYV